MPNEIKISGKVKDASLKYTQKGTAVIGFKLSVMHKSKKEGSKPTFSTFKCEAWKDVAESLQDKNDKLIEIKGYLKSNFYKRPDGTNVNQTVIVATEFREVVFNAKPTATSSQPPKKTYIPTKKPVVATPAVEEEEPEPESEEAPF